MQERLPGLRAFFEATPIIPAVRKAEHVEQAVAAHGKIVYLLTGDPENYEGMIRKILESGKLPIVNLDLLSGFSRDRYGVNFLKRAGAAGIISTHQEPLRHAISAGLYGIQRTFLLDSGAMDSISAQLKNTSVHAVEVLPAQVAPKMLERVRGAGAGFAGGGRGAGADAERGGGATGAGSQRDFCEQPGDVDWVNADYR